MRAALLVTLGFLVLAPAARADPTPAFGASVVRPADNAMLDQLRAMATRFWAARGVAVPAGENYLVDRCACGAYDVGADIYVPVDAVAWVQLHPTKDRSAWSLCTAVVHEAGHAGGLGHSAAGVMSADVDAAPSSADRAIIPWPCRVWARARAAIAARGAS